VGQKVTCAFPAATSAMAGRTFGETALRNVATIFDALASGTYRMLVDFTARVGG
jgi:hypothetical protein